MTNSTLLWMASHWRRVLRHGQTTERDARDLWAIKLLSHVKITVIGSVRDSSNVDPDVLPPIFLIRFACDDRHSSKDYED